MYGGAPPTLTESKIPVVAAAARRNRLDVEQARLRDLAAEIEWAKVSNVRPDDYERVAPRRDREVAGLDPATVGHVFASYEELKRDQGRMDMEDVLLIGAALLAEDDRVAAEVHRQYKWFVVDEFQDVSPIQSALLDLWLGNQHAWQPVTNSGGGCDTANHSYQGTLTFTKSAPLKLTINDPAAGWGTSGSLRVTVKRLA